MSAEHAGWIHLHFRSGSRADGARPANTFDYITRSGKYAEHGLDPAVYTESGHLPAWASNDARAFWDAADRFEPANARLYISCHFSLPRGLTADDRVELARTFSHELTDEERLPYSLAIHAGLDEAGTEHNPHAHLMFSERGDDGIARDPEGWFRRGKRKDPEHSGAPKSQATHAPGWVRHARERWAGIINEKLAARGRPDRVDHRSYAEQGLDREPLPWYGYRAVESALRGEIPERLEQALAVLERERQRQDLEHEIARLDALRASMSREGVPDDPVDNPRDQAPPGRDQPSDDLTRGR